MFHFYIPWTYSGGLQMEQWSEKVHNVKTKLMTRISEVLEHLKYPRHLKVKQFNLKYKILFKKQLPPELVLISQNKERILISDISRDVFRKRCFENMQQIYRRTSMPKCDFKWLQSNFIEITLRHGCSPINLLHVFETTFIRAPMEGCFYNFKHRNYKIHKISKK